MPRRKPVRMNGTDPGSTTRRKMSASEAPNDRATRRSAASVFRTPAMVLMMIGKSAPRKMTAIFDGMSMPNQMMNSGMSTMRGVL